MAIVLIEIDGVCEVGDRFTYEPWSEEQFINGHFVFLDDDEFELEDGEGDRND